MTLMAQGAHLIGVFIPFGGLFVAVHQLAYIATLRMERKEKK